MREIRRFGFRFGLTRGSTVLSRLDFKMRVVLGVAPSQRTCGLPDVPLSCNGNAVIREARFQPFAVRES